jgi:hypothetical protein
MNFNTNNNMRKYKLKTKNKRELKKELINGRGN